MVMMSKLLFSGFLSHIGIRGSDLVDALAKNAHTLDISTDTMLPVMKDHLMS